MGLKVRWNNQDKIVYLTNTSKEPAIEPGNSPGKGDSSSTAQVTDIQFANNQLVLSTDGAVQPIVTTLKYPDRLVVDLPGTTFGVSPSRWIKDSMASWM